MNQTSQKGKKGTVGAPYKGRKYVQMRLHVSYTPDEIDYLRAYMERTAPQLIAVRRETERREKQAFDLAQTAQKAMQNTSTQNGIMQLLINMTGTRNDEFTNEQHARIFAVSCAEYNESIYIPNSKKSTNTRAQYVLEKCREYMKKNHRIARLVPVVGYPSDARSIGVYEDLQQELAAAWGACKIISI